MADDPSAADSDRESTGSALRDERAGAGGSLHGASEAGGSRHGPPEYGSATGSPAGAEVGVDPHKIVELDSDRVVWKTCGEKGRVFVISVFGSQPVAVRLDCTYGRVAAFCSFLNERPSAENHTWRMRDVGTSDPPSEIVVASDSHLATVTTPLYIGVYSLVRGSRFGLRAVSEPISRLNVTSGSIAGTVAPRTSQFFLAELPPVDPFSKRVVLLKAECEGPGPLCVTMSKSHPYPDDAHNDFTTTVYFGGRVVLPLEVAGDTGRVYLGATPAASSPFKCSYTLSLRVKRPEGRIPNKGPRQLAEILRARRAGPDGGGAASSAGEESFDEGESEFEDLDVRDQARILLSRRGSAPRPASSYRQRPSIASASPPGARPEEGGGLGSGLSSSLGPEIPARPRSSRRFLGPPGLRGPSRSASPSASGGTPPGSLPSSRPASPGLRPRSGIVQRLIDEAIASQAVRDAATPPRRSSWRDRPSPRASPPGPASRAASTPRAASRPGTAAGASTRPVAAAHEYDPSSSPASPLGTPRLSPVPPGARPPSGAATRPGARLVPGGSARSPEAAGGAAAAGRGSPSGVGVRLPATARVLEAARQREQERLLAEAARQRALARRQIAKLTGRWALDHSADSHTVALP
eukprot:tig00001098_g7057.t1